MYWSFILSIILILSLIVLGTIAVVMQSNLYSYETNVAPYCYTDWKCINPEDGVTEINMSQNTLYGKSGLYHKCNPLTEEQLNEFKYIDNGKEVIKYPGTEVNIWSTSCRMTTPQGCPFYKKGDIYWPSCSGNKSSRYYTPPEVYDQLNKDSIARRNNK